MDRIISKVSSMLVQKKILTSDEGVEVFAYGLDLLLFTLISKVSIVLLGILFGRVVETIIYTLSFSIVQALGGGYHAKTHLRCLLSTVSGWMVAMLLMTYAPIWVCLSILAVGTVIVFIVSPVEHANAPMSAGKRDRMRRYTRYACFALATLSIALCYVAPAFAKAMMIAIGLSAFSKVIAIITS